MNLIQFLQHYLELPQVLLFLLVVAAVVIGSILLLYAVCRAQAERGAEHNAEADTGSNTEADTGSNVDNSDDPRIHDPRYRGSDHYEVYQRSDGYADRYHEDKSRPARHVDAAARRALRSRLYGLVEEYEELILSGGCVLLFVGIYFLVDVFGVNILNRTLWNEHSDIILLGMILLAVLLNTLVDHFILPLRHISARKRTAVRFTSMIYMIVIFAYIKFIYQDNNYDSIITYYLIMMVGRFVYFDTTWDGFVSSLKDAAEELPILALVLGGIALLSWYGFSTGYLLRSNGVVMSLFITHLFIFLVLLILRQTGFLRALTRKCVKGTGTLSHFEKF